MSNEIVKHGNTELAAPSAWDDLDELPQYTAEDAAQEGGYTKITKLTSGMNQLRFLPKMMGKKSVWKKTAIHWYKHPDWEKQYMLPCIEGMPEFAPDTKAKCPGCNYYRHLEAQLASINAVPPKSRTQEQHFKRGILITQIKRLQPQYKYRANVVFRNNPTVVKMTEVGKTVFDELKRLLSLPEDMNGGNWTDPKPSGYDVLIEKTGDGMDTDYATSLMRRPSPLAATPELARALWEQQIDLDSTITMPDMEDAYSRTDEMIADINRCLDMPAAPEAPQAAIAYDDVPHATSRSGGQLPFGTNTSKIIEAGPPEVPHTVQTLKAPPMTATKPVGAPRTLRGGPQAKKAGHPDKQPTVQADITDDFPA